jgi:hypothetical protein
MKKLPKYTLVYRSTPQPPAAGFEGIKIQVRRSAQSAANAVLGPLREKIAQMTLGYGSMAEEPDAARERSTPSQTRESASRVRRVGIWDLGAWVGGLADIVATLNKSQKAIQFFEVHAAVPAGLRSSKKFLMKLAEERLGRPLDATEEHDACDAILGEDFFPRQKSVRTNANVDVDCLVALTPDPIAKVHQRADGSHTIFFDFFTDVDDERQDVLVSVDGVRPLATEAGRPFEMAVGYLVISAVLEGFAPDVKLHADTGCLFDFNEDRNGLVPGLRAPMIDRDCAGRLGSYSKPAQQMLEALSHYQRPKEFS